MTGPDTAADLTVLAGWIDEQLGDETADRQWIAESAAARVRDITLQMLGAAALARGRQDEGGRGPFETEAEAAAVPAVQAVRTAWRANPGVGHMDPHNLAMLMDACTAAGVETGTFDRRILGWLANYEPETCAVIAGLISRAAGGAGQLAEIRGVLAAFDWEHHDRQYAMERIEEITLGGDR